MNNYVNHISPDSFSGVIFALEGIKKSIILLNGPTGCKYYHSAISDSRTFKQTSFDPLAYTEQWYFGQPRVPCTYLDERDYVYGSEEKLIEALTYFRDNVDFDLIAIVNSPGAALIGDDLIGICGKVMTSEKLITVQTPDYSKDIYTGYKIATDIVIDQLCTKKLEKKKKTVNILGSCLFTKYFEGDIIEIKRLLSLCDIEVNCTLMTNCTTEEIEKISSAELNIVLYPEYALETAQKLKDKFGTEFYVPDTPIGFDASEKMIYDICEKLGADSTKFTTEVKKARAKNYVCISRLNSLTGLPTCASFGVEGSYSQAYGYSKFLIEYFGMLLYGVNIVDKNADEFREKFEALLAAHSRCDAMQNDELKQIELVLANGNTISRLQVEKQKFVGIETSLPSLGYIDVVPKTHFGINGAMLLTEQVLNGLVMNC